MALNIKNREVEKLVEEIIRITGESKTEAVRRALDERKSKLSFRIASEDRATRLRRFIETEVWSVVPEKELGRRLGRPEEEAILGYGEDGV
ncbi:MAG: type II toxin-antitoxin system VapB family antitoxin [Pseudomonadota bacterium]|nr:type II toxin-antitoxin system VapB family antitoxin [Pseudomonadota bacterium]